MNKYLKVTSQEPRKQNQIYRKTPKYWDRQA